MRLKNDRLYTNREYDEELGMYYYRGRHYDPRIGRFIQRDPIGMSDDVNLYRYVGNSFVNATDPRGLEGKAVVEKKWYEKTRDMTKEYGQKGRGATKETVIWTYNNP